MEEGTVIEVVMEEGTVIEVVMEEGGVIEVVMEEGTVIEVRSAADSTGARRCSPSAQTLLWCRTQLLSDRGGLHNAANAAYLTLPLPLTL
ncbi:unnamed protein product [Gadus morhua 'NCC']